VVSGLIFTSAVLLVGCGSGGAGGANAKSPPPGHVDQTPPSVTITTPTNGDTYVSAVPSITIGGNATDDVGVTLLSWRSDRGGNGQITPTTSWLANGIALQLGDNRITVTAQDASGKSGSDEITVTYSPTGGTTLTGMVDSSRIDRAGVNAIYVYRGNVAPDDIGGSGANPIALGAVLQDAGACTWRYVVGGLAQGVYTIAFTNQAGIDNPSADDAISFVGTVVVNLQDGMVTSQDFGAAKRWSVGPTRTHKVPSEVSSLVDDGDVVEIDAGTYLGDVASWYADNLVLRGIGGRAHLNANGANYGGKATWVIAGRNTTVENIEFSNSTVPDQNGAGIRQDGPDLTVCNSYFHDNENGILGGSGGEVLIEYSEFARNGYGDGRSHNMYILDATKFTFRYSYSHHAKIGHNIKTRAHENHILYSRIMDEAAGTSSYAVDVPDCGITYLVGNLIQQGPDTDNSTIITYGAEACSNGNQQLHLASNTIVNDRSSGSFLYVRGGTVLTAKNNLFVGTASVPVGIDLVTQNLMTESPGFADRLGFDYHLTVASPRDNGVPPGTANGVDLTPVAQYMHPRSYESRPSNGILDMGAYEYLP